ncbi:MAG: hypothetical protein NZO58_06465 [Gemmataceae bacterium]|nr:hypothetical protein [Gemmataceae bacterium]
MLSGPLAWLLVLAMTMSAAEADRAQVSAVYPPLPRAVSSFGAVVADGFVYVYGGHVAKTHEYSTEAVIGDFYRLPLKAPKAWEKLPSGPAVQGLALVAHRGKVIRIGGMQPRNAPGSKADNHSLASCASYDPALGQWTPLPDLPQPRSSHDAVVIGDRIYVVGGWTMHGSGKPPTWCESALVLDLAAASLGWREIPQPFQRRALVAAAHGGKLFVIGGLDRDSKPHLTVNIYDPQADAWTTGPNLPGVRRNGFSAGACVVDGNLYVCPADGSVLRLSVKGDAWEPIGEIKQRRIVHRLVAAPDRRLLVLGGANGGDNVSTTEVFHTR